MKFVNSRKDNRTSVKHEAKLTVPKTNLVLVWLLVPIEFKTEHETNHSEQFILPKRNLVYSELCLVVTDQRLAFLLSPTLDKTSHCDSCASFLSNRTACVAPATRNVLHTAIVFLRLIRDLRLCILYENDIFIRFGDNN